MRYAANDPDHDGKPDTKAERALGKGNMPKKLVHLTSASPTGGSKPILGSTASSSDGPGYPYGTEISLGEHELTKLGVKGMPAVGSKVHLRAQATVKHSGTQDDGDGPTRSVRLQITHLHHGGAPAGGAMMDPKDEADTPAIAKASDGPMTSAVRSALGSLRGR